jgi:predicted ATPase/DNA-binding SARP family transcriptional activator
VRVEVLGPLRLVVDGVPVDVRGPKRRAVLGLLALAEGRAVTVDHLLDALWPSELPESGRQALHSHVSRLRTHLGAAASRLTTLQDAYRLELGTDELDLTRARALLRAGRAEVEHDPSSAYARLRQAHELWRGPMLADLADVAPIATPVEGIVQLHREVTDALVGAAIAARQADAVVGLAAAALADDPLREPAVLLLMRALAAAGRAPEALRTGREYRRRLADETGLDPSPALDELERDVAGGAAGPAPARSAVAVRPTTRLIGREAEVAAVRRALAAERLVTLVGPGGVGKTRVALEVAHANGATVLLLAPVTDATAVPHALAAALGLIVSQGDVLAACIDVLRNRPGLLVVDNCEHLLDAVRDTIPAVLAGCPDLRVLATTREPLGLAAEYTSRLGPLPLPGPDQDLARVPSVAVFLDRAGRVRPGVASTPGELRLVADIVRRLDGMPLAIELAAGRLSTFSLADLHGRLDRALDLLGGGRPAADARHRTLRATVEWSYRLLAADEQRLFGHLSVFVDGVDLDTAERLAADLGLAADPGGALARLVDASMIEVSFTGGTRYRMLETLRAFGLDRLTAEGERDAAERLLVRWAVRLVRWIGATLATEREPDADAALRRELANLRAAWRLARERGCLDDAAAIVKALFDAVFNRDLIELRGWATELAEDPALAGHPDAATVLGTAAYAAYLGGDYARAERLARAGLELPADAGGRSCCLHALAVAALARGAYGEVVEHCLAGAADGDPRHGFLGIAAIATAYAGDHDAARRLNDRWHGGATSPSTLAWAAYYAGEIENAAGRSERAEQRYVRAVDLGRSAGAPFVVGVATVGLLSVRATTGRIDEALHGYREVIDYFARTGNWTHQWTTLRNLADLLRRLGDDDTAAVLDAASDAAPDAPARDSPAVRVPGAFPGRAAVLDLAREAVERHLRRPPPGGPPPQ